MTTVVAVLGASGFVGGAVCSALERAGAHVVRLKAPRLPGRPVNTSHALSEYEHATAVALSGQFANVDVVINAAGNPDASSEDSLGLIGANALLPGVCARACEIAGVRRFIHVSSAVVQGDRPILDETENVAPFSAYATAKVLGERFALSTAPDITCVYRPASVHGSDRRISRFLTRLSRSSFASVARSGLDPTPQTLVQNVADALSFLALYIGPLPRIVAHPWEGHTTADLLTLLSDGQRPLMLPRWLCTAVVRFAKELGRIAPVIATNARRLEMLWFGQQVGQTWLDAAGWRPAASDEQWRALGNKLRHGREHPTVDRGEPRVLFGVTTGIVARSFFEGMFRYLRTAGWQVVLVSPGDHGAVEFARTEGARHRVVPAQRNPSPIQDARTVVRLMRTLLTERPHVAVWGTPKIGLLGTLAGRLSRTPSVYVIHGLRYESATGVRRQVLRFMEKMACMLAREVITVGNDVLAVAETAGILTPGKARVLGHGSANGYVASTPRHGARARLGIGETDFVVGFVGRVTADKGVSELLEAWDQFRPSAPKSTLVIAGLTEADADREPLRSALASSAGTVFLGHVDDLSYVYSTLDVLVLPTYREGLPTVVLEAASYGVPSIVTDATGASEPVVDGKTGRVVPVGDVNSLAEALAEMRHDAAWRRQLGKAAQTHVSQRFDRTLVHRNWCEYLTALTATGSTRRAASGRDLRDI